MNDKTICVRCSLNQEIQFGENIFYLNIILQWRIHEIGNNEKVNANSLTEKRCFHGDKVSEVKSLFFCPRNALMEVDLSSKRVIHLI